MTRPNGNGPGGLQRRSQVSLAGGLTEFQGGGDKPQYLRQKAQCSHGGVQFFPGGGAEPPPPRGYGPGPRTRSRSRPVAGGGGSGVGGGGGSYDPPPVAHP